jgi:hypothetical protein
MHDAAMRSRIAALVLAALLSVAAASVVVGAVADDAHAKNFVGTERGE